jgi:hypothetical protein
MLLHFDNTNDKYVNSLTEKFAIAPACNYKNGEIMWLKKYCRYIFIEYVRVGNSQEYNVYKRIEIVKNMSCSQASMMFIQKEHLNKPIPLTYKRSKFLLIYNILKGNTNESNPGV